MGVRVTDLQERLNRLPVDDRDIRAPVANAIATAMAELATQAQALDLGYGTSFVKSTGIAP